MAKTNKTSSNRKKLPKSNTSNQITKSKRLTQKSKSKNNQSNVNLNTSRCNKPKPVNLNNKEQMPSLADLEEMFEDSDDTVILPSTSGINSTQEKSKPIAKTVINNDLLVPCIVLTDIEHHSRIRRKNSCAFDAVDYLEGPTPKKKIKKDYNRNNLEHCLCSSPDIPGTPESIDSTDTIIYDSESLGRFSPLPSTSSDNARIHENDKRFNASLTRSNENLQNVGSTKTNEETQSDVEVIESCVETIMFIDDSQLSLRKKVSSDVGITIVADDDNTTDKRGNEVINVDNNTDAIIDLQNFRSHEDIVHNNEGINTNDSPDIINIFRSHDDIIHVDETPNEVDLNDIIFVEDYIKSKNISRSGNTSNTNNIQDVARNDEDIIICMDNLDDSGIDSGCPGSFAINMFLKKVGKLINDHLDETEYFKKSKEKNKKKKTKNTSNCKTIVIEKASNPSSEKPSTFLKDCPICMDSLATKDIASTICGHIFCLDCMKILMSKRINKRCPTCREVLKGIGYHQIFF